MSSTEATDGFISEFIASDGFHEAAINSGYIHKDEIKTEIEALIQLADEELEGYHMVMIYESDLRKETERRCHEAYTKALQDIAKQLEIEL